MYNRITASETIGGVEIRACLLVLNRCAGDVGLFWRCGVSPVVACTHPNLRFARILVYDTLTLRVKTQGFLTLFNGVAVLMKTRDHYGTIMLGCSRLSLKGEIRNYFTSKHTQ